MKAKRTLACLLLAAIACVGVTAFQQRLHRFEAQAGTGPAQHLFWPGQGGGP